MAQQIINHSKQTNHDVENAAVASQLVIDPKVLELTSLDLSAASETVSVPDSDDFGQFEKNIATIKKTEVSVCENVQLICPEIVQFKNVQEQDNTPKFHPQLNASSHWAPQRENCPSADFICSIDLKEGDQNLSIVLLGDVAGKGLTFTSETIESENPDSQKYCVSVNSRGAELANKMRYLLEKSVDHVASEIVVSDQPAAVLANELQKQYFMKENLSDENKPVAFALAITNFREKSINVCAGGIPITVLHQDGRNDVIAADTPGLHMMLDNQVFTGHRLDMKPGSSVVMMSDGYYETARSDIQSDENSSNTSAMTPMEAALEIMNREDWSKNTKIAPLFHEKILPAISDKDTNGDQILGDDCSIVVLRPSL